MLQCPHCQRALNLKGMKPGRFKPRCPACRQKFLLNVPEDPHDLPSTQPLPPEPKQEKPAELRIDPSDTVTPAIGFALGIDWNASAASSVGMPSPAPASAPASARATPTLAPTRTEAPAAAASARGYAATATAAPASAPVAQSESDRQARALRPKPLDAVGSAVTASTVDMLGGYQITRKLGQGGMGAVYLARQLSLDRHVAVKVLHSRYAGDPQFVARFVREAYAAAQLTHHNVVQIHDIGAEDSTHYYSMEYVPGQNLADLVLQQGRLDPQVAAGYVLQAARGLKYAHGHGMIHRDIKPENLLINEEGIVKIADLGLVKTLAKKDAPLEDGDGDGGSGGNGSSAVPAALVGSSFVGSAASSGGGSNIAAIAASHVTAAQVIMGTPAYMAPEQADDATNVDARADIYSLGCTFYVLLTGKAPFEGNSTEELIRKHKRQPMPPPHQVAKHVPEALSAIVLKMTAKRAEDRYQNVSQVVRALEDYLEVEGAGGKFSPRQEHIEQLERCAQQFNRAPAARLRSNLMAGFFALTSLGAAVAAIQQRPYWVAALLSFGLFTFIFYQLLLGVVRRTDLFVRLRQMTWSSTWSDWAKWMLVSLLAVGGLFVLDLLDDTCALAAVAGSAAILFYQSIDRLIVRQRRAALEELESMLRGMRLRGLEEDALRQFVCHYSGTHWEELYETLFGYEAMHIARRRWSRGLGGQARPRYAVWRDPIIRWLDQQQETLRIEREHRHIQQVEARGLEAEGIELVEARRRAKRVADDLVDQAAYFRTVHEAGGTIVVQAPTDEDAVQTEKPLFVPGEGKGQGVRRQRGHYLTRRYGGPLQWIFGAPMRFALAAVLIVGFITWRYQNRAGFVSDFEATVESRRADPTAQQDPLRAVEVRPGGPRRTFGEQPLTISGVPETITRAAGTWNALVAGAILLFSTLFKRRRAGLFVLLSAAVALVAHWFVPRPLATTMDNAQLAMVAGAGLALISLILFRGE